MLSKKLCIAFLIAVISGFAVPVLAMNKAIDQHKMIISSPTNDVLYYYKDGQLVTKEEYEQARIVKKNYDDWLEAECMKDQEYQEIERKIAQETNRSLRNEFFVKQYHIKKRIASGPNAPQIPARILSVCVVGDNHRCSCQKTIFGLPRKTAVILGGILGGVSACIVSVVGLGFAIKYAVSQYKKHRARV